MLSSAIYIICLYYYLVLLSKLKQSMVVYQFHCFCKASYIGITSRQLIKRVKEHIKSIKGYCDSKEKETKSTQVLNALKRSSSNLCKQLQERSIQNN